MHLRNADDISQNAMIKPIKTRIIPQTSSDCDNDSSQNFRQYFTEKSSLIIR